MYIETGIKQIFAWVFVVNCMENVRCWKKLELKLARFYLYFIVALAMSLAGASPVISHQMHGICFMCFLSVAWQWCHLDAASQNAPCVDANHHHYYNVLRIKALIPCWSCIKCFFFFSRLQSMTWRRLFHFFCTSLFYPSSSRASSNDMTMNNGK